MADKKLHLSLKDWEALRMQVDRCYDNFTQKLNGPYQLDERELRICLLIKTRFSCKEIGSLINMSQSGVSIRKEMPRIGMILFSHYKLVKLYLRSFCAMRDSHK